MRSWIVVAAGLGVFGALLAAACGDTSFTAGGTSDGSPTDASGSDVTEAAAFDDGSSGNFDGGDPCLASAPHQLCDDFDKSTLSGIWGQNAGCANPALDDSVFASPPHSLAASNDAGQYTCSYFDAKIAMAASSVVHCEVDAKIEVPPPQFFDFFKITTAYAGVKYYQAAIQYAGQAGGSDFPLLLGDDAIPADGGKPVFSATDINLTRDALGSWVHMTLEIDFAHRLVNASVGGVQASMGMTAPPGGTRSEQDLLVRVGFEYVGEGGPGTIAYDNVFCDIQP